MFLRLTRVFATVCLCALSASGMAVQSQISIDEDIRIFAMVTALNVAGFDAELNPPYHEVRAELRKVSDGLDPDLRKRMRDFYSTHKAGGTDDDQLAKYISLAIVLTDPPFKAQGLEEALPDDARSVLGFVPLLQEFYQKAGVSRLWARVSPAYEQEMNRIGPSIRAVVARTDAYLRIATGALAAQTMRITVELGAPKNTVNVRSFHDDYSVILGYATTPKTDEIQHAYLHVRLNNYAAGAALRAKGRTELITLLRNAEGVERQYSTNFENMFIESVVRAMELRLGRLPAATVETSVKNYYRSGLLLLPYFYESMPAYESGENNIRDEITALAANVNVGKEQERFEKTFYSIPLPQKQVAVYETPVQVAPPAADPVLELLRTAQAAFEKDKPRALEAFEKVLAEHSPNDGRALYGIALIEMDRQRLDEALEYFERTIASDNADRSMKTWSYIYAGHILDFKCNRAAALEKYRKAIETGDDTRDAQKIAKRDLAQPFGGECQQ